MSEWSLTLKIDSNGLIQVEDIDGTLPPGSLTINGSDDGNTLTLAAQQRDVHGRFTVGAHHHRDRAVEAVHNAEKAFGDTGSEGHP